MTAPRAGTDRSNSFYAGRRTLVTGGTDLIGPPLVEFFVEAGEHVWVASLRDPVNPCPGIEYVPGDLMSRDVCAHIIGQMD
jgi:nucleoside-diphosphate-sugar epimerase